MATTHVKNINPKIASIGHIVVSSFLYRCRSTLKIAVGDEARVSGALKLPNPGSERQEKEPPDEAGGSYKSTRNYWIAIWRGLASSRFGNATLKIPSLNDALAFAESTLVGRSNE